MSIIDTTVVNMMASGYKMSDAITPEERLIKGINLLANELKLNLSIEDVEWELDNLSKEKLIDTFVEMKALRLRMENLRLINLLLD